MNMEMIKDFQEMLENLRFFCAQRGRENGVQGKGANDALDAFEHAYASALLVSWNPLSFGNILGRFSAILIADVIGVLRELLRENNPEKEKKMDLFNNAVGRRLAPKNKQMRKWIATSQNPNRKIAEIIANAVKDGETINSLDDPRLGSKKTGKYIWRAVSDGKTRTSHALRDGKIFEWNIVVHLNIF